MRQARRLALLALAASALPGRASETDQGVGAPQFGAEVPYVQTPMAVVDAMLELAGARAGDRLVDLGSGDGRLVIRAAQRFGIPGLGVDLDPNLVALSEQRARDAGVAGLARFAVQDLFDTDLTQASLITMYLLPEVNLALRPRLLRLAPGTRVVSHDWDMGDWMPDHSRTLPVPDKPVGLRRESAAHLWVIPASVQGDWRGRLAGEPDALLTLRIAQRYQQLQIAWRFDGAPPATLPRAGRAQASMTGEQTRFEMPGPAGPVQAGLRLGTGGRLTAVLLSPDRRQHDAMLQAV
jgi:SAM-dependent methyltransferase